MFLSLRLIVHSQVIRVLSQQEQSLEEAVGAVTRAVRTAKEAIVGDLVVAHALPGSRGVAQVRRWLLVPLL